MSGLGIFSTNFTVQKFVQTDNGIHQRGNWGYCKNDCPDQIPTTTSSSIPQYEYFKDPTYTRNSVSYLVMTCYKNPLNTLIQSLGTWIPSGSNNECGRRLDTVNVLGGSDAKLGAYPFVALVGLLNRNIVVYACGGSIINSKYVLTAAHCQTADQPIV